MTEEIAATKRAQIGLEATPGTAATIKTKFNSLDLSLSANPELTSIKPRGSRFATGSYMKREWGKIALSGMLDYNEIAYVLDSAHHKTTASGESTAKTRQYKPSTGGQDTHATYTVENGDAGRAIRGVYGLITQYKLSMSRKNDGSISGSGITRALEDDVAFTTSGVTAPAQALILPTHWSVYQADTYAGLSTASELKRVFQVGIESPEMAGNIWPMKRSVNSFDGVVDKSMQNFLFRVLMAADDEGMAFLTAMRAQNGRKYIKVEAIGEEISTGVSYTLRYSAPIDVKGMSEFKDEDGVYAVEWQLEAVDDGSNSLTIDLINTLATIA